MAFLVGELTGYHELANVEFTVLAMLSGMESGRSQGGQPGLRTVRRRIPLLDRMEHEPNAPMPVISGLSLYQRLCHPRARQITTGWARS
jgi:hypothetical protein